MSDLDIQDKRIEFIAKYVIGTFMVKNERWFSLWKNETMNHKITSFFDTSEVNELYFTLNSSANIQLYEKFPVTVGNKVVYFIKKEPSSIDDITNLSDHVLCGDVCGHPISQLYSILDQITCPLISSERKYSQWSDVIFEDILTQINSFKSKVHSTLCVMNGKTTLEGLSEFGLKSFDLRESSSFGQIESLVIDWKHQIQAVLDKKSPGTGDLVIQLRPCSEIDFWNDRLNNLEGIIDQLRSSQAKLVSQLLRRRGSLFLSTFEELIDEVEKALHEAREMYLYLDTLKPHFDQVEQAEFHQLESLFRPLMHTICLVWIHSTIYRNKPDRFILLMRLLSNLVIDQCFNFVEPTEILKSAEYDECCVKLGQAINTMNAFRQTFTQHRSKIPEYVVKYIGQQDSKSFLWDFKSVMIFKRFDACVERLKNLEDATITALHFSRLEKVAFGGDVGGSLNPRMTRIHEHFFNVYTHLSELTDNPLESSDVQFTQKYDLFCTEVREMRLKLANIFCQALDDTRSSTDVLKLDSMLGSLIDQPIIKQQLATRLDSSWLKALEQEVDLAKHLFNLHRDAFVQATWRDDHRRSSRNYIASPYLDESSLGSCSNSSNSAGGGLKSSTTLADQLPMLNRNMPPIAGALEWVRILGRRLTQPFESTFEYKPKILQTQKGSLIIRKFKYVAEILNKFEKSIFNKWIGSVDSICAFNLSQPLLRRNPRSSMLEVNFDHKLVVLLREVGYLRLRFDQKDLPLSALKLYQQNDELRQHNLHLASIVQWHTYLTTKLTVTESELVKARLDHIDCGAEKLESVISWSTVDAASRIQSLYDETSDLYRRVVESKDNLDTLGLLYAPLASTPLFERHRDDRRGFQSTLLQLDDRQQRCSRRYGEIESITRQTCELVEKNRQLLLDASQPDDRWWMEYVVVQANNQRIVKGLVGAIETSLDYLLHQIQDQSATSALFKIELHMKDNKVSFLPSLNRKSSETFYDLFIGIVEDIYRQASRASSELCGLTMESYETVMQQQPELVSLTQSLSGLVDQAVQLALTYRASLASRFGYLWKANRRESLEQFLAGDPLPGQRPVDGKKNDDVVGKQLPPLDQFKQQIDRYEGLYQEVSQIDVWKRFDSWLLVDVHKFKQALLFEVKQWSLMFKQYLLDHVTNSLSELKKFVTITNGALQSDLGEGDYKALVDVMTHLGNVKERQEDTDIMFDPLKATIELLETCEQEVPGELYELLEQLPQKWNNTKKLTAIMKQKVAPLQNAEVIKIRQRCKELASDAVEFQRQFEKIEAFDYTCKHPYVVINKVSARLAALEHQLDELTSSSTLFEVTLPEIQPIQACRQQLCQLKQLWDKVYLIVKQLRFWTQSPWRQINFEQLDSECKKFAKDLRLVDPQLRSWNVFIEVEVEVKNMLTSLQAVADLQNSAIRDRHWRQLMNTTRTRIELTEETRLKDLMALNLHVYEEEVRELVDQAVKEMSMESTLGQLDANWSQFEFDKIEHPRTGLVLLKPSEELIETLEENLVQLQNLTASKHVAYFIDQVSRWQKRLSIADQVITSWMEVQRTWSHLESIFIATEDIRSQLPQESKLFDGIDADFRAIASLLAQDANVLNATSLPNLTSKLEAVQTSLAVCEKALSQYLETKRLAFPRFYFISSAALLDILSNGTNPRLVAKHLSKLFDSLTSLDFQDESINNNVALAMHALDGERVELAYKIDLKGQVEVWLNLLLKAMRDTVKHWLAASLATYIDTPRDQWIFDFPAQIALTGSQIGWASEVGVAFGRLEEGLESALKDYNKRQIQQLNALINLLVGDLTPQRRQKVMTLCTIDVHNRDVVGRLVSQKVDTSQSFAWISQLRHRWSETGQDCYVNICDAEFRYAHEYLGNTPRLVITPLTDRCYVTLTQSLHLTMSGAPAGPAGTGKTETTKDLARALGTMVYVFNCSEQMDYKSIGNTYKGLAQTGAWGCFDEFNRISIEVLSVVAVQVKSIHDAIREKKREFNFLGETISIDPRVGIFITMNPGYAGRTELPENLKALFRPCAMVVPDFELICEIMLVAEGFTTARLLARKFLTLYNLCKELLSRQDHYDWGLRAIKSVLVVAGSLKRNDPKRPEDQVLMRALRDFNTPKIVADDLPVFMGLIGDLFPALQVPRRVDLDFEGHVRQAALDLQLQPEDNFLLKAVQLHELFAVRHSVFLLGNAGTGKSMVWRTLHQTFVNLKARPVAVDLDPKVVTNAELFGAVSSSTHEWKDGLFSTLMRDLAALTHDGPKWIVLDGDIDPMWIESLNTVMDDNKVLTLANNERIPLTKSMRLLFEISHLQTATPATVSRAGILFLNQQDLGTTPFIQSWLAKRPVQSERNNLEILFNKYKAPCLDVLHQRFKTITPIVDIALVQTLTSLLECHLTSKLLGPDSPRELYETYFVFCVIWAFGGALFHDQLVDHRVEFSKWWQAEFKTIKFPLKGTVFDYYIDPRTHKFEHWSTRVPDFELDPDIPLQSTLVPTAETCRLRYFLDHLITNQRPVMLIGAAGTGKSVLVGDALNELTEQDLMVVAKVPFNFYTSSASLQAVLERSLEKKAGRNYGPPGSRRLVYCIDDLNMPEVDAYHTVQPHCLIRQHIDHSHWYDRNKLTLKEVHNTQYVACMNQTAGSFTIDPRLQRHFCVFALSFPGRDAVKTIYSSILNQHLIHIGASRDVLQQLDSLIDCTLALHTKVASQFLPTAVKFHYVFNLRDLSNIFQGLLFASTNCISGPVELIRLWMHEAERVYSDKLTDRDDVSSFAKILNDTIKRHFTDQQRTPTDQLLSRPNQFSHFTQGIGEPNYASVSDPDAMLKILVNSLDTYNELNASMNLVFFDDAVNHLLRINRILESPRGNAMLIGVGGSGKQSLARLASFISSIELFQLTLKTGYNVGDLKADLASIYLKVGLKNTSMTFLLTDAEIADEQFLVLVNDLLASGDIPGLLTEEEMEKVIASTRLDVKQQGLIDSRENCYAYFIAKVRQLLKVVLCFSPVGSTLRDRARKFPALINCTQIDWFHVWPQEALLSVGYRFISTIELLDPSLYSPISQFMAFVHQSVNEVSQRFLANERRYNYTTPTSFLEQVQLYKSMLASKHTELEGKIERLTVGLTKLESTSEEADKLREKLAEQEVEVNEKNAAANDLLEIVSNEQKKVEAEQHAASVEQGKVSCIKADVLVKQRDCQEDLAKAEPALMAAQEALNTLNKGNLTEMKSFGQPPTAVAKVAVAVMILLAPKGQVPRERSWKAAKANIMGKVDTLLDRLINYNKENIHENCLKAVGVYLNDPEFDPGLIRSKSTAAAGLCAWVINIINFYHIYCDVKPKRDAVDAANEELRLAEEKLEKVQAKLLQLEHKLKQLTDKFEEASLAKRKCQADADATLATINLAGRLVGGLTSESVRWTAQIDALKLKATKLPGDILITCAFLSYIGAFTKPYRVSLFNEKWLPYLASLETQIPITDPINIDPVYMLADDADIAEWNNQSLPSDRMSIENAILLLNAQRWPLLIDPQLQAIKWVKSRLDQSNLVLTRPNQVDCLTKIEHAVSNGLTLVLEGIGESIDPVLGNLLGRATIRKGRAIKLGDKEIDYDTRFRMIMQTKLGNPHYKPELQAKTTLINFTVTRDGLEDQLLANVVNRERPDLEASKSQLTLDQNRFKISLKELEDSLLARLSSAGGNLLGNVELVENLETSKQTALDIADQVEKSRATEASINAARELYRPVATRGSLLYFIINDLHKIHPMYQFSLKAFYNVFDVANKRVEHSSSSDTTNEDVSQRVTDLVDSITFSVFTYTSRGLFERDKLTFTAQMTFQIQLTGRQADPSELDFLLRSPIVPNLTSPIASLSSQQWGAVKALSDLPSFRNLDRDIESSTKRWKRLIDADCPEKEQLPQDWKHKSPLQHLCILRTLRPDRMVYAIRQFVASHLGAKYVTGGSGCDLSLTDSYKETRPSIPIFFILSPGVDPLKDVELLGRQLGFSETRQNFHNISLGQGQEKVAEEAIKLATREGHWVVLQNVHLVAKWLPELEKLVDQDSSTSRHTDYRMFISAEPATSRDSHIIPQGILENAVKITNEPPTGMRANLHKALTNFDQETLEMCTKEHEFKSILFGLCYFHAVVCERRKFGAQGWNRNYPFNVGDLTISVNVLYNYLESAGSESIPWEDLRYLFGDIMYGGHITDNWDRRLCRTYLEELIKPEMFESNFLLAPGFAFPLNTDYQGYHKHIDSALPSESPSLYGLHPNSELEVLTVESDRLFRTVLEMQPRDSASTGQTTVSSREDKVQSIVDELEDKVPEEFVMSELQAKAPSEHRTPYVVVALQECERMNGLLQVMRSSLKDLRLGLKGELTTTAEMESLANALDLDLVPDRWLKLAYPSLLPLGSWFADLLLRVRELEAWTNDMLLPNSVWLGGLFNPQSFLTAIMQQTARKNDWPLDRMTLGCEVTKKVKEELANPPREGACLHGLFLEGARWDSQSGLLVEARFKELTPSLPVCYIKAVPVDRQDLRSTYACPVYKTKERGPTYVWTFNLKTKSRPAKWILGGVAILLQA